MSGKALGWAVEPPEYGGAERRQWVAYADGGYSDQCTMFSDSAQDAVLLRWSYTAILVGRRISLPDFEEIAKVAFNTMVKSEPRGAAKGQYQCDVSADGLTLTQRKKTIEIPPGTAARYVGKNQLEVSLPDHRLQISVAKFGSYQNRLAKDIAAFLSGDGSPPVVANYTLPWYFYAVSALPVGIPIITLGGALPGALGFGLAAVCFGISQKETWSITARLLVVGALVTLAYLALFALMAAALASQVQ